MESVKIVSSQPIVHAVRLGLGEDLNPQLDIKCLINIKYCPSLLYRFLARLNREGEYMMPKSNNTKGNVIQLMGKEPKKQMKRTHQAIQKALRNNNPCSKEPRH